MHLCPRDLYWQCVMPSMLLKRLAGIIFCNPPMGEIGNYACCMVGHFLTLINKKLLKWLMAMASFHNCNMKREKCQNFKANCVQFKLHTYVKTSLAMLGGTKIVKFLFTNENRTHQSHRGQTHCFVKI